MKDTFDDYCHLTWQLVNFDKLTTYFNKGTCNLSRKKFTKFLGVRIMADNERHLRNPLIMNKNRNNSFQSFVCKIKSKIMSQQIPLRSQVGKSILIKLVALVIPIYNMVIRSNSHLKPLMRRARCLEVSFKVTTLRKRLTTPLNGKKFVGEERDNLTLLGIRDNKEKQPGPSS